MRLSRIFRLTMSEPAADRIIARELDKAASYVSGLILDEIDVDGHQVANMLWKISGYLKKRAAR